MGFGPQRQKSKKKCGPHQSTILSCIWCNSGGHSKASSSAHHRQVDKGHSTPLLSSLIPSCRWLRSMGRFLRPSKPPKALKVAKTSMPTQDQKKKTATPTASEIVKATRVKHNITIKKRERIVTPAVHLRYDRIRKLQKIPHYFHVLTYNAYRVAKNEM